MEIGHDEFFQIFKNNFDYEIIDTIIGRAIKMHPYDAFIYSTVTGSGYLTNPIYPFTLHGLTKVFYNAFDYKFVTGLYENTNIKNSPRYLKYDRPYIFTENKYILPVAFNSEIELTSILEKFINILDNNKINPQNFIIQRIETRKKGNGMEPFCEYITCEYFKTKGYIVETQIPLSHSIGSPDFAGYILKDFNSIIPYLNNINNGFHLIELSMINLFTNKKRIYSFKNYNKNNLIVGEAKTSTTEMTKQLNKYLDTSLFDKGYEIHPQKKKPKSPFHGLISIGSDYKVFIREPEKNYKSCKSQIDKNEYYIWLNNYIKYYLFANFSNDQLNEIYYSVNKRPISNQSSLSVFINSLDFQSILQLFKQYKII